MILFGIYYISWNGCVGVRSIANVPTFFNHIYMFHVVILCFVLFLFIYLTVENIYMVGPKVDPKLIAGDWFCELYIYIYINIGYGKNSLVKKITFQW
jgi:hypothetical protein